ncbi:MAG: oligosaccharide flippase family protein, partial [Xanthomonadales bacterium]|nr:oligosaccharide flippase family protein [Xanthomonadales bacterium]
MQELNVSSLTSRATNATWWSTLEIASRYGVQIIVTIVLARLLTPTDFGLIAMLLVFTNIGAILVDSGFGTALIQRKYTTPDDETTVFVFGVTTGVVVAVILWLAAPLIADFYRQPRLVALIHLVMLVLPLGGLAAVPDALLTKRL